MRFYNYVLGNETKYYPKKVQEKINAGEGAAMLAIWAVVLIGCKNTLAYGVFQDYQLIYRCFVNKQMFLYI